MAFIKLAGLGDGGIIQINELTTLPVACSHYYKRPNFYPC